MFREIGGNLPLQDKDFFSKPSTNNIFGFTEFKNTIYTNSGRSAFAILLDQNYKGPKNVVLPAYTCITCIKPFVDRSFNIQYYTINKDLTIDKKSLEDAVNFFNKNCILYFHAYFGFNTLDNVKDYLSNIRSIPTITLINDTTHSWLANNQIEADYYISSLRKWLQTPDGGALSTNLELNVDYNTFIDYNEIQVEEYIKASRLKNKYLSYDKSVEKTEFYPLFKDSVSHFKKPEIRKMSPISKAVYDNNDYKTTIARRKQNCQFLCDHIKNPLIEKIFTAVSQEVVPFYYPIYLKTDRSNFQQYLAKNDIFCPIHWGVPKYLEATSHAESIYPNILSLVCDQRYNISDMQRFVEVINNYK